MAGLNERIRAFYDQSTPLWLDTWGEQMPPRLLRSRRAGGRPTTDRHSSI